MYGRTDAGTDRASYFREGVLVNAQLQLDLPAPHLTDSERKVLTLLVEADGAWVSGLALNHVAFAYSQRIGALIRKGYRIERKRRGEDGLGWYRLVK